AGPGGSRPGDDAVARAEQDLPVRADVDQAFDLWGAMKPDRERRAQSVGADEARDVRQRVHAGVRLQGKPYIGGDAFERIEHQRVIGRRAEAAGIEAAKDVGHRAVADYRDVVDTLACDARSASDLRDEGLDRVEREALEHG